MGGKGERNNVNEVGETILPLDEKNPSSAKSWLGGVGRETTQKGKKRGLSRCVMKKRGSRKSRTIGL